MLHINTADKLFKPYQLYKHVITAIVQKTQTYKFFSTFFVIDFFFITSSKTAVLTCLARLDDTFNMS